MSSIALSTLDTAQVRRQLRRRKLTAFFLVAPLLLFLLLAFVAPIGMMLVQSFYHPDVADLAPDTLESLSRWDGKALPPAEVQARMAADLKRLAAERRSGKLAEEVNRVLPGSSSVIKSTARKLRRVEDAELAARAPALLAQASAAWEKPDIWRAIAEAGELYTPRYFLTSLDLEMGESGIQQREGAQLYVDLYLKTLKLALMITLLTLLAGYPLAYYLANAPPATSNILMVFVLLPFWTSLLVRTTSWIVLLQNNGVVNSTLMNMGILSTPLDMLYTQFSTVLAMTHILLPFMILPLYSVMKGIDPSFLRAAMSLGGRPIPAFFRVYLPMTMPGLSAGALLVFIVSVGYYITPALLGGTDGQMISNIIAFHMQRSNNWGLAAALGSLLLALILIIYWLYDRFVGTTNIRFG